MLMKNALVMYDRETDSLWSHFTGEGLSGRMKGKRLEMLQAVPKARWDEWRKLHPNTKVLSVRGDTHGMYSGYAEYHRNPNQTGIRPVKNKDDRLPPKSFVLGILVDDEPYAVPLDTLREKGIVHFRAGDKDVVAYYDASIGLLGAVEESADDPFVAFRDRALVTKSGKALAVMGDGLKALPAIRSYWFAWADYHPKTKVIQGSGDG